VKDLEVAHVAGNALFEPDATVDLFWSPAIRIPPVARSAAGQLSALSLAADDREYLLVENRPGGGFGARGVRGRVAAFTHVVTIAGAG